MTSGFRLTPRAVADLAEIADHTVEVWGTAKMEEYVRSLVRRFAWLSDNALAGRERNDVHPGYRSFPEGSHIIFYVVSADHVDIIGIPHKAMDIGPSLF